MSSSEKILWGIDLGGTKIEAVVIEAHAPAQALCRRRIPTQRDHGYEFVLNQVKKLVEEVEVLVGSKRPLKIGFGTPGVSDSCTGVLRNSNTLCFNGRSLQKDLSSVLGIEALLANDANCFALAEATLGAARGKEVVMGLILGTGVGGGVVINGHLIRGLHGIAGEWGHNTMRGEEAPCYCGKKGCNEQVFSGPALEAFYEKKSGQHLPLPAIVRKAESGDTHAVETLERLQEKFAEAIAVPINILDPDVIIIGGGVGNIDLLYTQATRDKITQGIFNNTLKYPFSGLDIGEARPSAEPLTCSAEGNRLKRKWSSEVNGCTLKYPFSGLDIGEARPSAEPLTCSAEGNRLKRKWPSEVNGCALKTALLRPTLGDSAGVFGAALLNLTT